MMTRFVLDVIKSTQGYRLVREGNLRQLKISGK